MQKLKIGFNIFYAVFSLLVFSFQAEAAPSTPPPVHDIRGIWEFSQDHTLIEIDIKNGEMIGKIYRRPNGRTDEVDKYNPADELKQRPIVGLKVFWGLKLTEKNTWENGVVYDPDSGNTYQARAMLEPDGNLKFNGYIWLPLIGRSETLKRFSNEIAGR